MSKAVLNLNQREHCLGLSYIAMSQVKTLAEVLFEVLFDFDCFIGVDLAISRDRDLDYTIRSNQLL